MARQPISVFDSMHAAHGNTVRLHVGGVRDTVLTRDPALVQHVLQKNQRSYGKSDFTYGLVRYLGRGLLTNAGADWQRQRRLIQPGFHRQRLAGLTRLMCGMVDEWVGELAAQATLGQSLELDMHPATTRVAFRIIARAVFGNSLGDDQVQQLNDWFTSIQEFYLDTLWRPYLRPWHWVSARYHDRLALRLRNLVSGAVARHRAATAAAPSDAPASDDLLQMLLEARYEDTGEPMTDKQLLDELIILLVAGHETSANAVAWAAYLLARHPDAQARLLAEIERELPNGRPPEFADLPRLTYTLGVVNEAMRLFPPAWVLDRVAEEADEFQGEAIAPGTLFSLYIYGLHRHPALWPAPDEFRPERFVPGAEPPPPPHAYYPFGGGPRMCVGNQFALTELQLILVQLVRRFQLSLTTEEPPTTNPLITLRPGNPLRLRLTLRPAATA